MCLPHSLECKVLKGKALSALVQLQHRFQCQLASDHRFQSGHCLLPKRTLGYECKDHKWSWLFSVLQKKKPYHGFTHVKNVWQSDTITFSIWGRTCSHIETRKLLACVILIKCFLLLLCTFIVIIKGNFEGTSLERKLD